MSGGDWKAMFKAVQQNDLELVKFYLRSGVDPNYQHPEFMALPLSESIRYNHLEIAQVLLENGAEALATEMESGTTPLDLAKRKKMPKAVDLLGRFV
jgi:ankyrin repeat protein